MTDEQLYHVMWGAVMNVPEFESVPAYLIEELLAAALRAGVECGGLIVVSHLSQPNPEIDT